MRFGIRRRHGRLRCATFSSLAVLQSRYNFKRMEGTFQFKKLSEYEKVAWRFKYYPFPFAASRHISNPLVTSATDIGLEGLHDGFIFQRILFFPRGAAKLIFALHFISPVW